MIEPTPIDLEGLVDEAIALPDGVINCTELNRLLKYLVERVTKLSIEIEKHKTSNDERFQSLDDAVSNLKDMNAHIEEEDKQAQPQLIQCGVAFIGEPEQAATSSQEVLEKELTLETLLKEIDEQASRFEEQESKLLEVIRDLEQRLEKMEQLVYQKLGQMSEDFEQFQAVAESKQTSVEKTTSAASVQEPSNQMNKITEFTDKLDELQRQMELLLSHRDQLPMRIETLLEEKLREAELMSSSKKSLQPASGIGSRKGSATPSKSFCNVLETESAGTTQPVMENLSCLACDTKNVMQRKRDSRYLAPRTSAKLAMVVRRLEESEAPPRLKSGAQWSRACGGSHTVVKPDERVFRQSNVQFNRTTQEESS